MKLMIGTDKPERTCSTLLALLPQHVLAEGISSETQPESRASFFATVRTQGWRTRNHTELIRVCRYGIPWEDSAYTPTSSAPHKPPRGPAVSRRDEIRAQLLPIIGPV